MLLMMLIAQAASAPATAPGDQDRVAAAEVFDYAGWRTCALKETHRKARSTADHAKVADMAMSACAAKEDAYRSSLAALAQTYKLADPADFARRNVDQARGALHALMIKELQ